MELMIVVAIFAIVGAIALPSYTRYVERSHRADAQGALVSFAQHLERRYTENNSYCDSATADTGCGGDGGDTGAPTLFPASVPLDGGDAIYDLTVFAVTDTTFEIRAVRTAGAYMSDDECGDFSYTNTGVKDQVDGTFTEDDCW